MLNINMTTKGAINQNSILSINLPDPESIKNQKNIKTINSLKNQYKVIPIQENTMHIPKLYNPLKKGQKIAILSNDIIEAYFGWNTDDIHCDVDVSAFLLDKNDKVLGDDWFVFYGQTTSPDKSTMWIGEASTDRQKIDIDIKKINANVQKIVFVLTIDEALTKKLHFGMIRDAYIRIMNQDKEIVSFMITEYDTNIISMVIGELYLYHGQWKFNAVGNGLAKDLAGLCEWYGVAVIS